MSSSRNKIFLQVSNIIAFFSTVVVNILANTLPINGKTTAEISDSYPNLFVPAGLTFSIWGVIYVLLGLFVVYQGRDIFKSQKEEMHFLDQISYLFILSSAANILWIFFWHYELVPLSLVAMLIILTCLLAIYLRLNIGKNNSGMSRIEKFSIQIPFSVYLGWITVATIANVTALLVSIEWDGFGISEAIWTIIILIVATVITLLMLFNRKDIAYSLVIIWAFIGIIIKRLDPSLTSHIDIVITASIALVIIIIGIIFTFIKKKR